MADFDQALKKLMELEGQYSNHPDDPGGETMFGITELSWQSYRGDDDRLPESVRDITEEHARQYYLVEWWEHGCYDKLENQRLATLYFVSSVNMGEHRATQLLQICLGVEDDGLCGPKTLEAAEKWTEESLVAAYASALKRYYSSLNKPQFTQGWMNRVDNAMA